jgi:endonuclease YncB( thermonuclease family)
MRTFQSRDWQHTWHPRPSQGPAGPKPVGVPFAVLVVVLAVALAIHGFQRSNNRLPVRIHADLYGDMRGDFHADIVGKVRVIDGDTIVIRGTHIRLNGIDAPEADQTCTDADNRPWRCGRAATRVLIERIAGRPLTCSTSGLDRYRRVLARCALPDGSDINAWMVQQGWALAYYSDAYRAQEAEAQAAKRGIWAGTFIPPWMWRHRHRH